MGEFLQFLVEIGGSRLELTGSDIFTLYPLDSEADNRPKITPALYRMLAKKKVKEVSISEATLSEMIDWFRHYAPEINIVNSSKSPRKISLNLRNVSVAQVLHLTNAMTHTEARLGSGRMVEILDRPEPTPSKEK